MPSHQPGVTTTPPQTSAASGEAKGSPPTARAPGTPDLTLELRQALERLDLARRRMLSAAIAFCDGTISSGQLRAVRELLREQEVRIAQLQPGPKAAVHTSPFVKETPAREPAPDTSAPGPAAPELVPDLPPVPANDLLDLLSGLDAKLQRLEEDLQQGRINASQYRAIHRHYTEQREVALRLRQAHPESDRWRVVLEEGKTSFLLQLNEAVCHGVALYDMASRERIFVEGRMPPAAEEAMALLRTFGPMGNDSGNARMLATQAEDGSALLLIPGRSTAALVVFSQQPPGWQVRALREVHRNFEAANKVGLERGDRKGLFFPDLTRFIRPA
jgi:hypothetical protein